MGVWGIKILQNDTALDVKDELLSLLHKGKNGNEAIEAIFQSFSEEMNDPKEADFFWVAFADTLWGQGLLTEEIKARALESLLTEIRSIKNNPNSSKENQKRQTELFKEKDKLVSPQPPKKSYRPKPSYHCDWHLGDVFAYKIESEYAKEKGLFGRFFIIIKVDEVAWGDQYVLPIVRIKITNDNELPKTAAEINALEYVQIFFEFPKNKDPLFPLLSAYLNVFDGFRSAYKYDEFGLLPRYQIILYNTSKRIIPKTLIFLGNFQNIDEPKLDNVLKRKDGNDLSLWKHFEEKLITRYFAYNKKEALSQINVKS